MGPKRHILRLLGLRRSDEAAAERRRWVRRPVNLPIRIAATASDESASHLAVDVSDGGILVTPNSALPDGAGCIVALNDDERIEARVLQHRLSGTVLLFMSPERGSSFARAMAGRAHAGGGLATR